MRTLLSAVSMLSLCASSLLLGGCEVSDCKNDAGEDAKCGESLTAFEAEPQLQDVDYVPGASVTIKGLYGDIAVMRGDVGTVSTKFMPFNYRGNSQEADAQREIEENLDLDVSADDEGTITISVGRHDASNGLGSHVTVGLPPEFDGTLVVQNEGNGVLNQGLIDVQYVAEATTLNVLNNGLELCSVLRGDDDEPSIVSALTDVDVRCEADIIVRGVNDNVVVQSNSTFHSDVVVEIVGVSATAKGGSIRGGNSNVQLTLPAGGDYDVVAATGPGAHIDKLESDECEVLVDEETEAELRCGAGGPVYEVIATDTEDDDENSRVNLYVR